MHLIRRILKDFKTTGLYPELHPFEGTSTTPHVKIQGEEYIMFGSNNYLGICNHPEVTERTISVLREHGLGPGGSRILCGNVEIIAGFEKKLANFVGVEDTITFPTGYMANTAIFQAIMGPFISTIGAPIQESGVIYSDEFNHATIVDGCRLTPVKKVIYKHNDLNDLKKKLSENGEEGRQLIVSESVYSTEGLLTDIPAIVEIAKQFESMLMIDDAHGIGVLGQNGGGVIKQFSLNPEKPEILMASFDKALGTIGGFLGGKSELIDYLRIASRPYIFSSAIPAVVAAATTAVIDIVSCHPEFLVRVQKNAETLRNGLRKLGYQILGNDKTPAVPLFTGEDSIGIRFSELMFKEKIYVPCFRWPAAPKDKSRIRISVMASHSDADIDDFIGSAKKIGKKLKMI